MKIINIIIFIFCSLYNSSLIYGESYNYSVNVKTDYSLSGNFITQNGNPNTNGMPESDTVKKDVIIQNPETNTDSGIINEKNEIKNNNTEEKNNNIEKKVDNPAGEEKKENIEINKNAVKDNKNVTVARPALGGDAIRTSLLEYDDPDLKEQRIPGIALKKAKIEKELIEEKPAPDSKDLSAASAGDKAKGSKKGISSIIIWAVLICLIIGIIILFRFRSKSRGGDKVLRRFPGA